MTQEALKLALEALKMYGKRHRATYLLGGAWDEEITLGDKAITAIEEALAQPEQKMVMWPCLIDTAYFSKGTVTIVMQCEDYKVSAGTHWLSTTPPKENT